MGIFNKKFNFLFCNATILCDIFLINDIFLFIIFLSRLDYNLTEASDKNFHFFLANATIT